MEDITIRRRNRLRHHYTITSNVLLFEYQNLSDGAKLTYQVIDSFDWSDSAGLRKGFAFPSMARLAAIRGVDQRSIRRHLAQLETAGLVTIRRRPGQTNLLVIEDPSAEETRRYLEDFASAGEDKGVRPPRTELSAPLKEDEREGRLNNVNEIKRNGETGTAYEHISHTIREVASEIRMGRGAASDTKARREYLAQQMLEVLGDRHSLGCYRRIAERCPPQVIHETLGVVKEMARDGKVRRSRGALFVTLVKRAAPP